MPRRSPPSSLRLFQGPVPARSVPKAGHTLPSVPRPTFSQPATVVRGPEPRQQANHDEIKFEALPDLVVSPVVGRGSQRGPWDHSQSFPVPVVVERLLTRLEPVALSFPSSV
ncbi:hypothetical protein HMN09_00043900 [Mycena chlorophos]|uniref:Uncharacterized protein n=1 Tax=Mycena chlorophos TaxID=658473 RepID=A0A8H6WPT6_MYCCL|nr:hypothetical protein HMN09_00043900 [Mycena chlorophos]